jgi:hypothetical protein
MNPRSIEGIVEDSVATCLWIINNNMNVLDLQFKVTLAALTARFSILDWKLEDFECN